MKISYSIEPYNPKWASKFANIAKSLADIFGSQAIAIEHIGSTSIPGMKSKPTIDVLILVEKIKPFEVEKEKMMRNGYDYKDNYIAPDSILFYKTSENEKVENIHVLGKSSQKANSLLATRDYLRLHPQKAREYESLKEKLKQKFAGDYVSYREGKNEFLTKLTGEALEWQQSLDMHG